MNSLPYPGLRPFKPDETDIFFGRDKQTDQLIEKLGDTNFIAVLGLSGCGKSSLVRTGLLADLKRGFLDTAGERWRVAELQPGDHPFLHLAEALLEKEALGEELEKNYTHYFSDIDKALGFLQVDLRQGPFLHDLLNDTPLTENTNLLLVVDQFEEIFRYYQHTDADEAAAFVEFLLASSRPVPRPNNQKKHRIYVVITMRSDFIGNCATFYDLPEAINQGLFLVPRLSRGQLREAIEGPARVFGGEVESPLVNRLLNSVGSEPDQLPLLQHALMRMWTLASQENPDQIILTEEHDIKVGGLKKALSNHADEAYAELDSAQQTIAEILFRSLCDKDIRRPVKLKEVKTLANVSWEKVAAVVNIFRQAGRNFLMPPPDKELKPDSVIDISHESLIRQWQRLKEWAKEEAEFAELYQRLEETARRWEKKEAALWRTPELEMALRWREKAKPTSQWAKRYGQDFELAMRFLEESEKEKERKKREQEKEAVRQGELKRVRKQAVMAVFGLIVMTGLALWGFWAQELAEQRKADALSQREIALFTVNTMTSKAIDQLAEVPGTAPILGSILEDNIKALAEIRRFFEPNTTREKQEKAVNLLLMGDNWLKLGNNNKALATYQNSHNILKQLAQEEPQNTEIQHFLSVSYTKLGEVAMRQDRKPAALEAYQQALTIDKKRVQKNPHDNQAQHDLSLDYYNIVEVYLQLGNPQTAKDYFLDLLKTEEQSNMAYYYLGYIAEKEPHFDNALSWYQKVDKGLKYIEAQGRIALILAKQGQLDHAIEHLHSLSVDNNEDKRFLLQFEATLLTEHARYEEAIAVYTQLIDKNPDNTTWLLNRAVLAKKLNNFELFEQDLQRVLEINPENVDVLNSLGYTLADKKQTHRYQEAYQFLKKALALQPNNPNILDSLGWVLYRLGNYSESLHYLHKAQAKTEALKAAVVNPATVAENAAHLGEVLWVSGKPEEAKQVWGRALREFPDDEILHEVVERFLSATSTTN
jgi:tetratricopeptide (TPR) repeat protein